MAQKPNPGNGGKPATPAASAAVPKVQQGPQPQKVVLPSNAVPVSTRPAPAVATATPAKPPAAPAAVVPVKAGPLASVLSRNQQTAAQTKTGSNDSAVIAPSKPLNPGPTAPAAGPTKPQPGGDDPKDPKPRKRPGARAASAIGGLLGAILAIPVVLVSLVLKVVKMPWTYASTILGVYPREFLGVQVIKWLPDDMARRTLPAVLFPIAGNWYSGTQAVMKKIEWAIESGALDNLTTPTPLYRVDRLVIGGVFSVLWTAWSVINVATESIGFLLTILQESTARLAARLAPGKFGVLCARLALPEGKDEWYQEFFSLELQNKIADFSAKLPDGIRRGIAQAMGIFARSTTKSVEAADNLRIDIANAIAPNGVLVGFAEDLRDHFEDEDEDDVDDDVEDDDDLDDDEDEEDDDYDDEDEDDDDFDDEEDPTEAAHRRYDGRNTRR